VHTVEIADREGAGAGDLRMVEAPENLHRVGSVSF
jgi:hypothetical protein